MGLGQNIFIFSMMISIFLYLGGVRVITNDSLGSMFNVGDNPTLSTTMTGTLPQNPQTTSIQSTSGGFSSTFGLVDGLNLAFNFIKLLINLFGATLAIFTVAGLPIAFIYMIGVPLVFMQILAVITFVRGIIW